MKEDQIEWYKKVCAAAGKNKVTPGLVKAIQLLKSNDKVIVPGSAIDLGCGLGRDTLHLLANDWKVLAVDINPYVIEKLESSVRSGHERLRTQVTSFEDTDWVPATLINASFALPYCPVEQFDYVWSQILASLIPGGVVVSDFFGLTPGQPRREDLVMLLSRKQLDNYLTPLKVLFLQKWYGEFINAKDETVPRLVYTVVAQRDKY